jgi:hypothetical protein
MTRASLTTSPMRIPRFFFRLTLAWLLAGAAVLFGTIAALPADRPVTDLSGEWEFRLDPRDIGRAEAWYASLVSFDRTLQVPGAWNAQGVAYESEELLREYEQMHLNGRNLLGEERESVKLFHVYPGPGWYRRRVTIPAAWQGRIPWLVLGGVHREAEVWVNGQPAGSHRSYLTPFRINLSPFGSPGETVTVVVRVDARRRKDLDPLMGCMDTLDFLYVSWGGLHRPVFLEATDATRIADVFVVPQLASESAEIRVTLEGTHTERLTLAAEVLDASGASAATIDPVPASEAETVLAALIQEPRLWSPTTPHLYTARVRLLEGGAVRDVRSVRFGMREFRVVDGQFHLNGKPIFLRGYGDDCIFPNTICPPADRAEMRRRLGRAREYGFNYVRHHSWTPPKEYLEAADELGMMLQPEFPFAYRWDLPSTPEARRSAIEQWEAMIRLNRNHPSIVTWCMGNELYDSFEFAPEMYRIARRLDPTRPIIDSDGSSFRHHNRETLDFMVVQFNEGGSIGFGDGKYRVPADIRKPVVAHEMGYFVTLPDLAQLELFDTGLRPYWLIQTRELAARNGVLEMYPEWLAASYRLQAICLKSNLEAARRSRLSGTSVWLFQDYPNCAEGVVDMFLRDKAFSPAEFRAFNAPTVLLLDMARRNWWGGEPASFNFAVSRFEDDPSEAATLRWTLEGPGGVVAMGAQEPLGIHAGGVSELPAIQIELPEVTQAGQFTLKAALVDAAGETLNAWDLWVFPRASEQGKLTAVRALGFDSLSKVQPAVTRHSPGPVPPETALLVTTRPDLDMVDYLEGGGRVILLDPEPLFPVEKTQFRLSSWDGGGPSGTIFEPRHAALRGMPSAGWCDLQFYQLIQGSRTVNLDADWLPADLKPLVRCIDRPTRLADRAYLFEIVVGQGKLMVSGFNFAGAIDANDPAGVFLLDHLMRYALGPEFLPGASLPAERLREKIMAAGR